VFIKVYRLINSQGEMMSKLNFKTRYLGIDLGTDSVVVSMEGKGVILKMPTIVAVDKKSKKLLAIGNDAKEMLGREPDKICLIKPLKSGVIADLYNTELLLKSIISIINKKYGIAKMVAMLGVPLGITEVEKRAAREALYTAGIKNVYLIDEPLAGAFGAGIDISKAEGNLIVDMGAGTTQVAVVSVSGIVVGNSIRVAGDILNDNIIDYIRKKYKLEISEVCAENIKKSIGSATLEKRNSIEITGRDLIGGFPKKIEIVSVEILESIAISIEKMISVIKVTLEKTPPELASDIKQNGIILTGGIAGISGVDQLIQDQTGIPVETVDNPELVVSVGALKCLKNKDVMRILKSKRR